MVHSTRDTRPPSKLAYGKRKSAESTTEYLDVFDELTLKVLYKKYLTPYICKNTAICIFKYNQV